MMDARQSGSDDSADRLPIDEGYPNRRERHVALERGLVVLVTAALVGSVLAIGAVHTVVLVPVAAIAIAAAIVAVPVHEGSLRGRPWPAPALILVALSLFTALQALPLPLGVLAKIAPANADIWARSLLPFGEHPTWGSLSLDPGATLVEALKWLSYACVLFATATLARRRGTPYVLAIVFGSATLLAIVTVLHGMAEAKTVFGIYEPAAVFGPSHMGPLLNTNNLAGYLNLGTFAGMGLLLMRRPIVRPWLVAIGVAIDVAATVRSASRGGVGALIIGVLVLAVMVRGRGTRTDSLRQRVAPFALGGATLAFGAGLALLGGDVWVWRELLNDNLAKLKIVAWTVPLLREHAWLGVGRGAFESVFEAYRPASGFHIIYTHPENFPAQWASEWGIPVALATFVAFAWLFRPTAIGARKSAAAAAGWVAVLALAIQNLADLGLEIPAIGIATAAVLGSLWIGPVRRANPTGVRGRLGGRAFAIGVAAAGGGLAVLSLVFCWRDVGSQRDVARALFDRADDDAAERPRFRAALRQAMARRPAEHYFPLLGAMAAFRWKDQSAMPWLQHTLERAPVNGRAHALLASVLVARGARKQALFELRLALEHEPGLAEKVAPLAVSLAKTFEELKTVVPAGARGTVVLNTLARVLQKPEQAAMQREIDGEALARDPKLVEPRVRLLEAMFASLAQITQGKEAGVACATVAACEVEIERHAAAIDAAQPDDSLGAILRARGLIAVGKRAEAEALLVDGCARPGSRGGCLELRAHNLIQLNDGTKLDGVLKEVLSNGCTTARACAEASTFVGSVRASRGDHSAAAVAFARAAQEDPTEERWLRAADEAERAKMSALAIEALQRVGSLRGGGNAEMNARIARVREEAAAVRRMP